jgi:hypothetical protein
MSNGLTLGMVFSLVGVPLILIGVFLFIRTRIFISKAQEVKGTVIQMVHSRSGLSSSSGGGYAPIYQFRTLDGQTITIRDGLSNNPPRFQIGQEIDVYYDSENPQKARINKWMNLYFLPVLLGAMGLIFGGAGFMSSMFSQFLEMAGY